MKTFDEAVIAVMTVKNNDKLQENCDKAMQLQFGFVPEIMANPVVNAALNNSTFDLVVDAAEEKEEDIPLVIKGALMSSFMWGLAVGREMEKQEL